MLKNYTPQDLKLAYQLVQDHLLYSLSELPEGESLKFGKLGKFIKSEHVATSALKTIKGKTFAYTKLKFKPFKQLKAVLNEQIIKKYRLK